MFFLTFALLTVVYVAACYGVIRGLASYYEADYRVYLRDNDTYFFAGVGVTAVTLVIAFFNFGPALLLPETYPTPGQRSTFWYITDHLLYGKYAGPKVEVTDTLPWATGTWFWWKATGLYALLTFGYSFVAFYDEITGAYNKYKRSAQARKDGHHHEHHDPADSSTSGGGTFSARFVVDFITKMIAEIITEFFYKGTKKHV